MFNFQDLTKRLVVACSLIAVIVVVLLFAFHPIISWCVACAFSLFGAVALWEFMQLTSLKEDRFLQWTVLVIGVVFIMLFFLVSGQKLSMRYASFIFLLGLLLIFLVQFKTIQGASRLIPCACFALFYVIIPMGLMVKILFSQSLIHTWGMDGRFFLVFLLAVTKMTDVGAYFGGRSIGKRILSPRLSPKKTWEGALIGWACAVAISLLLTFISKISFHIYFSYQSAIILGALFGILSQLGDLTESLFKRDAGVKDSNKLPGIGGALDTLDSLLFTTPALAFYLFM